MKNRKPSTWLLNLKSQRLVKRQMLAKVKLAATVVSGFNFFNMVYFTV
jgi:hypothetical protein